MPRTLPEEPIYQTGMTDIYSWGAGQILKVFHDWVPVYGVEHVIRMDRLVYEAGLPVPEVGELIEVDGRPGVIYEHIEGGSMGDRLLEAPEVEPETVQQLARVFAELQVDIHTWNNVPEFHPQKPQLERVIREVDTLPRDLKGAILRNLYELPDGGCLCHGDFHPYNVLMSPRGPVIIDWNNASIGNPLADVALSELILSGVAVLEPSYRSPVDQFVKAYLRRYFELLPEDQQQFAAWRPVVAAVRLGENMPGLQEWLLNQVMTGFASDR
jgi:Ser/Thr protein kinase RdoA (MazF antagonist)